MPDRSEIEIERAAAPPAWRPLELAGFVTRPGVLLVAVVALVGAAEASRSRWPRARSVAFGLVWTLDTITTRRHDRRTRATPARGSSSRLELLGIGTLAYGLATVAEFFVSGQLPAR